MKLSPFAAARQAEHPGAEEEHGRGGGFGDGDDEVQLAAVGGEGIVESGGGGADGQVGGVEAGEGGAAVIEKRIGACTESSGIEDIQGQRASGRAGEGGVELNGVCEGLVGGDDVASGGCSSGVCSADLGGGVDGHRCGAGGGEGNGLGGWSSDSY